VSTSPITALAQIATANAQSMVNYRIQLVGNELTKQLNQKIAALQAAAQNPIVPVLQQQASQLQQQETTYTNAQAQSSDNGLVLADISLRLGNAGIAAQNGDAATFDQNIGAINTDIGILQPVGFTPGLQTDGLAALQSKGIGVRSSASYNLGTPAGQAQALSDIQAAQALIETLTTTASTNQLVASSNITALDTRISSLDNQIEADQIGVLTTDAQQIATLKQQEQEQFHVIELAFGSVGNTANMLAAFQSSRNISPPAGTILSVLVGASGGPSLLTAEISPPPLATASPSSSSTASASPRGPSSTRSTIA
jgi:hypothetical protein